MKSARSLKCPEVRVEKQMSSQLSYFLSISFFFPLICRYALCIGPALCGSLKFLLAQARNTGPCCPACSPPTLNLSPPFYEGLFPSHPCKQTDEKKSKSKSKSKSKKRAWVGVEGVRGTDKHLSWRSSFGS